MSTYKIKNAAIYRDPSNTRSFLYVETEAERPIELADEDFKPSIQYQLVWKAYATQSYALYKDVPITMAEFDDVAAIINGQIIDLKEKGEYRIRYLTDFNFILCAYSSVHNSRESDNIFGEWMDIRLKDEACTLKDFMPELMRLKTDQRYYNDFYS